MQLVATSAERLVRPHRIVMFCVYLSAAVAGWSLLPGDSERVAMLERDGHFREALTILENRYHGGDKSYRTISRLQSLYEDQGDVQKSGVMLAEMAGQRRRDANVQQRLAAYEKTIQNEDGYIGALKAQLAERYSDAACRDLSARLRLKGNFEEELATLQSCRQAGFRRLDDMLRLASLLAASGDAGQAVALLRSIDDVKRLKGQTERFQLIELLLDQGQPKDAVRRALRWVRAEKTETAFAVGIVDIFARSKFPDSAIEFAKAAGSPGDSVSLTVAERLLEQSQTVPAQLYLRGWLANASFEDRDTAIRFTGAALAAGDPETAFAGARRFGLELLPSTELFRLAEALDNADLIGDAAEVRDTAARVRLNPAKLPDAGTGPDHPQPQAGSSLGAGTPNTALSPPPPRRVLIDNLEKWRKVLASRMSEDAEKRLQAQQVGPAVPRAPFAGRHSGRGVGHEARHEFRNGNTKILKKTAGVLQRAKKNKLLRSQGKRFKERAQSAPAVPQGGKTVPKAPKPVLEKPQPKSTASP